MVEEGGVQERELALEGVLVTGLASSSLPPAGGDWAGVRPPDLASSLSRWWVKGLVKFRGWYDRLL